MHATDTNAQAAATQPASPPNLRARLARLSTYFGHQRLAWVVAVVATLVGAATEPLIPALLQPLLDRGFTQGTLQLWMVPVAILGVFLVRGIAQFVAQYALARIANEGMLALRQALFDRVLAAEMALFSRQSASALSNTVVYEVQTGSTLLVQALLGLSRDGFSLVALLFCIGGLCAGIPVVTEYLATGLVPRFPTAILAVALMFMAALSLATGFILDAVAKVERKQWELRVYQSKE